MNPSTHSEVVTPTGIRPGEIDHERLASYYTDPTISEYIAYTDGGCLNNGKRDARAYGSFKVFKNDRIPIAHKDRFHLQIKGGRSTNNMAEAMAINQVLLYFLNSGILEDHNNIAIIRSDSELTINQIKGIYQTKHPNLKNIARERAHILKRIEKKTGRNPWECIIFSKISRARIVDILGH
jgi:ribonuclease HI